MDQQTCHAGAEDGAGPGQPLGACAQRTHGGHDLGILLGQLLDQFQRLAL